ncbi:MAG: 2-oxoacid:acceptor oxidoreductase family protein [Candidatus Brocadiia bacterium]|nr:2-oxoacid:acceptor oxidoreductase family protein [Candidatus Brocadiia bacterium]
MTENTTDGEDRLIVAGFGGQGVLTLAGLLCQAAMEEGRQITYLPSYGGEVRSGTVNCQVVISGGEIYSPVVEAADSLIILNEMSFERFGDAIRDGGLLLLNTSLAAPGDYAREHRARVLPVRATELAAEMGNVVVANTIMLGAFLGATAMCGEETVAEVLRRTLTGRKSNVLELNLRALQAGIGLTN